MKFFLPKDLTFQATNVAENEADDGTTYVDYSVALGYNKGTIRKYGINLYEALTTMYPLAHYIWEDMITTDKHAVNLHTGVEIYPTDGQILIPVTNGVTVVYVRSNASYYIAKVTATVDFMAESMVSPSNFNLIAAPAPYRHDQNYPVGETDTLFWGYVGVANRYRALDRAVGTQTVKYGSNTYTCSFDVNSANSVTLFNVYATSITCTVYDIINPLSPAQIFTETADLTDTTHLNNYEKVCTIPHRLDNSGAFTFTARYAMRISLSVTHTGGNPGVGAIKIGLLDHLGETMDGVDVGGKSYNQSEQRPNGEVVWNKDNKESNKVQTLRYNVKLDTATFDSTMDLVKLILDKEVVLLGDDGDPAGYRTLRNYGAITGHSGYLQSNNTKSKLSIDIENFT